MTAAAIYARVSSDKQREEHTIASQTAALIEFAKTRGFQVPEAWVFEDEGFSGASLVRPGLESRTGTHARAGTQPPGDALVPLVSSRYANPR